MNKGKHSAKKRVQPQMEDIYSSSKKRKSKLKAIATVLLIIQIFVMAGVMVYLSTLMLIPFKIFVLLGVVELIICALQYLLINEKSRGRKRKKIFRGVSVMLTVVIFVFSFLGVTYLSAFQSSVSDMTDDDHEVAPNVAKVTKEPFIIYLSGSDTRDYSDIPDEGLSDVNMIIAVNPKTHKVLMVNTPRDYFVPLWGDSNKMDKLTHAGNYGIECSMQTLEALYDIKFNYYVKLNFKSVVDIVDALGGITVDSEVAFSSKYSLSEKRYKFVQGPNELTGDAALAFARERKSLAGGDRQRGKNQQLVIKAILDKAISPSILNPTNFKNILSSVTSNTKTNVSKNEITSLFRMQLNDMSPWDVQSVSVDGTGSNRSTYSYSGRIYVMIPDEATVEEAKTALLPYKK